jgi:hypothetical protein
LKTDQRKFFSIVFRLTGPRGGRFSPAVDVITFWCLPHLTSAHLTTHHQVSSQSLQK